MTYDTQQILTAVKNAGIIGAGGGGFPTHIKLQAKVETIIANGSECEPLLSSDRTMMVQKPELLIEGMKIAMQATGASEGIIGIKSHYHDAIAALEKVLPTDNSIKLYLLENYYPAGDEFLLVYEITKKIIPEGKIPLNVGVVVSNVITFMQIAQSLGGKPVTERAVTLAGEFNEPQVVSVPIGTTYKELINIAGGTRIKDVVFIDGGPMMGRIINNLENGIAKTTSGILALAKDNFVVKMQQKTLGQMLKQSKSACCQCFRCSDICPRNLIGHEIYPHMTMRTIDYNLAEPTKHITSAFLCSQCGVCELFSCDFMLLSPRQIYAAYKKELIAKGIKNPHNKAPKVVNSQFEYRKVAIPTLMKKLGISQYNTKLNYAGFKLVNLVRVPLKRHAGAPAVPQVNLGQKVSMTDVIAKSPDNSLGTIYHATICGEITDITDEYIEIKA